MKGTKTKETIVTGLRWECPLRERRVVSLWTKLILYDTKLWSHYGGIEFSSYLGKFMSIILILSHCTF